MRHNNMVVALGRRRVVTAHLQGDKTKSLQQMRRTRGGTRTSGQNFHKATRGVKAEYEPDSAGTKKGSSPNGAGIDRLRSAHIWTGTVRRKFSHYLLVVLQY